uniref:Uncharacterized protein n=1 Tax=Neobodo designis TaxID=312471 RepID=A0A7S1KXW5_NEODS|mmetsp:Transcript_11042/g.34154  ORF Transcript_11042/g.34154 Transcript_11042/m.34154 type:complete len:467 (+) Transcript_11042:32-1432(+)
MPASTHADVVTVQAFERAQLRAGEVVERTPGAPEYCPEHAYVPKHSHVVAGVHLGGGSAAKSVLVAAGIGPDVRFTTVGGLDASASVGAGFACPLPGAVRHVSFDGSIEDCDGTAAGALGELVPSRRLACVAATREGDAFALRSTHGGDHAGKAAAGGFAWERVASWAHSEDDETLGAVGGDADLLAGLRTSAGAINVARMGADGEQLVMAQESAQEARIFDIATGKRVRSVWCTHGPTAAIAARFPAVSPNQELLAIAEGPVCSIWDPRTGGEGSNACISRLTTAASDVLDVTTSEALAARNLLLVAGSDRSIAVFDVRKWAKLSVDAGVLKFAANGLAVVGVAQHEPYEPATIVATGIDTELRAVDIMTNVSAIDAARKRQAVAGGSANGKGAQASPAPEAVSPTADVGLQGAFRQRLATASHCRAGWHGAPSSVLGTDAAVAMSTHAELFVVCGTAAVKSGAA